MNGVVRQLICKRFQPWHYDPCLSVLGGPIGHPGTQGLPEEVVNHYKRHRINIVGETFELVQERALLEQFERIVSCLPHTERQLISRKVGFGAAQVFEINACAFPWEGNYGVLYDLWLDVMLGLTAELYAAILFKPHLINNDEFDSSYNRVILRTFYHLTKEIGSLPTLDLTRRRVVDAWQDLEGSFVIAHEIGHILKGHLDERYLRYVGWHLVGSGEPIAVYNQTQREEFEADEAAVQLILGAPEIWSKLFSGNDPWPPLYFSIGAALTKIHAAEVLADRIGLRLVSSHPPALQRRERVLEAFRDTINVSPDTVKLESHHYGNVERAVRNGPLPQIDTEHFNKMTKFITLLGVIQN